MLQPKIKFFNFAAQEQWRSRRLKSGRFKKNENGRPKGVGRPLICIAAITLHPRMDEGSMADSVIRKYSLVRDLLEISTWVPGRIF